MFFFIRRKIILNVQYKLKYGDEGEATHREHTRPVKIFTVGPFASI